MREITTSIPHRAPSSAIAHVDAWEVLDSRGNPTVKARVVLESGHAGEASAPAGASTGEAEARELRDGGSRYGGRGVLTAVRNVRTDLRHVLLGQDVRRQALLDRLMIATDGHPQKSRLGANAIVAVSMAAARAGAEASGLPLYAYLGGPTARRLPTPMMNVLNGGKHADNGLAIQEFMIVPHGASSLAEALQWGAETFHALLAILRRRGLSTAVGDEGGFAPELASDEMALDLLMEAIGAAGRRPGAEIAIAMDPAATSFAEDGGYRLSGAEAPLVNSNELLETYDAWSRRYPIVLIEDGFAEHDWEGFGRQTARMGDRVIIMGDDLYATNPSLIRRGIAEGATNAVLIKLNQIGTVTETMDAIDACREAGWGFMISHRSGETCDAFIADFAVAMGGGLLKAGSLSRGERLAKYNRLIEIERELGPSARFVSPFAHRFASFGVAR